MYISTAPHRPVACIEEETFDDQDFARIMCYLGFVYKYEVVPMTTPSLDWYLKVCPHNCLTLARKLSCHGIGMSNPR